MGSRSGGGGSGGGGAHPFKALSGNIDKLGEKYGLTPGGYFGTKGKNSRVIASADPAATANEFWKVLSKGGKADTLPNGKGKRVRFDDASAAVYRVVTSSKGSPAVEIWIKTASGRKLPAYQKIHFVLKESK